MIQWLFVVCDPFESIILQLKWLCLIVFSEVFPILLSEVRFCSQTISSFK